MFSFVTNFKKLTCTRLFFWKLSSKSTWCSPVSCRKELPQISFLCIPRTTTVPQTFLAATLLWSYSCKKVYSIAITKKIFKQKGFYKKLFQTNEKNLGRFEIKSHNVYIANNKQSFSKLSELVFIFSKLQVNENIRGGFPLLQTLKSRLLQDCSSETFQVNLPDVAQWTAAKNCCKLVFCVFPEQLLSHRFFGQLHCYEVTLAKKYI